VLSATRLSPGVSLAKRLLPRRVCEEGFVNFVTGCCFAGGCDAWWRPDKEQAR
jgi:hypothetical protein